MHISPDGRKLAYVLQTPDSESDEYQEDLYIAALDGASRSTLTPVMRAPLITALTWFPDNRHLVMLMHVDGNTILARVDSVSGKFDVIERAPGDITDYSMDATGDTIVISVRTTTGLTRVQRTLADLREGYRLDLNSVAPVGRRRRQIYVLRLASEDHWEMGPPLSFISPLSGKQLRDFTDAHDLHVTLSPNGRYLLVDNVERVADLLSEVGWQNDKQVMYLSARGGIIVPTYLYDLQTKTVSMPLRSPIVRYELWAPDSSAFVEVALAPVDSKWESDDLKKGAPSDHNTHLFAVDVKTGAISEILERTERPPLVWIGNDRLVIQDKTGNIQFYAFTSGNWTKEESLQLPLVGRSAYSPIASDGNQFVTEYENASTAPEIVRVDRSSARIETITRLNPQVETLLLPRTQTMTWTTSTGYQAKGLLLLPPDYDPKLRYPLVIENGSILYDGQFVCDSGADHVSSFARGILADSGIIYLMRYWQGNDNWKSNYYPKGFPGEIGEAAFQLDLVESAVKALDSRHIIDPAKVGLIGFSRGGWYTEYALAHSTLHFAAATATDNLLYSLGEYWLFYDDGDMHLEDGMYGGPPYGASLNNWLKYSISFNLDKIHTPLLMEVMGYGREDDDPNRPPINLDKHYEEFVGLNRLSKPVELYYYPLEEHQVDHPMARIAALQRNVDWYRFWLQGYERPNPDDPDQYKRWEHLRELRNSDYKAAGIPTTSVLDVRIRTVPGASER